MMHFISYISRLIDFITRVYNAKIRSLYYTSRLGECGKNVFIKKPLTYSNLQNIIMEDNTSIDYGMTFMSVTGKLIMKKGSGASAGLTVITGTHIREIGEPFKEGRSSHHNGDKEGDIIVGENVWIGVNVTLLYGAKIGREAILGAGTVCSKVIPPYAIVKGNPAKIVGFVFTPEEAIEHEKMLYPENERLSLEVLEHNYDKYFLNHLSDIKEFRRL